MKRWALVIAVLTVSLWATGQMNGYGGVNTSTGTAVVVAPPSQPNLVAPTVHLGTAAPVVGAMSATPGNLAGAVSSTMSQVAAPAPVPMVAEIANPVPVVMVNSQAGASPILQGTSGAMISGTANLPFNSGVGNPFGEGYTVGTYAVNQTSLGEIAREYRARRATEQARTFTNQDIQQMNQGGVSVVGGTAGATVTPGAPTAQPTGNAPAIAQPGATNPPATPGVATPVPPEQQSNPPQPPPMSQMQSNATTEMAQANQPAGMQEMQGSATTGNGRSQRGQLPRAASVLPLMALIGLLAAGAGLLAR